MADNTGQPNYAFIRNSQDAHDWATYAQQGVTPVLNAQDPDLEANMAAARQAGLQPAIWMPASTGQDPTTYGQQMASIVQHYQPSAIIPNVETQGEGAQGSAWSQQMMAEYAKYERPGETPVHVTVEANKPQGNQDADHFDYNPYLQWGDVIAEAFVGNSGTPIDPDQVRQSLINSGVPADKINILLRPGQAPGQSGKYSLYTIDDAHPNDLTTLSQANSGQTAGSTTTSGGATAPPPDAAGDATRTTQGRTPDAKNPSALAYSKAQLKRMAAEGYTPSMFGLSGLDPTAQWRAMSAITGARQAAASGHAANYVMPTDIPDTVAAEVHNILNAAHTPPPISPHLPQDDTQAASAPATPPPPATPVDQAAQPSLGGIASLARTMIAHGLVTAHGAVAAHAAKLGPPQAQHPITPALAQGVATAARAQSQPLAQAIHPISAAPLLDIGNTPSPALAPAVAASQPAPAPTPADLAPYAYSRFHYAV